MAKTTPTNVDSSIKEVWAKDTLREFRNAGFWGRFTGSAIVQESELLNGPGDLIHIQVTTPLTGAGVSGDTTQLEGNEENLTTSQIQVQPLLYRHGVRVYRRAQKKSILDLMGEAKMRLAEWGESKMDSVRFSQFVSADEADVVDSTYSPNVYVVGHGAGSGSIDADDLVAGDEFSVDAVRYIRYKLMNQKAKPIKTANGMPFYFCVITPEMEVSLKNDATYDSYARDARERGGDNPLFTGALTSIDGVVLLPHPDVPTAANATSVPYAKALAFGAEAFVEGLDENVHWADDEFDYGNELGIAFNFAFQPRRALELSSLQVLCANPAVTG